MVLSAAMLDQYLPQTQCTRCGYPSCADYADALARGRAAINRCPPGGDTTIRLLANALGQAVAPLDPEVGLHGARLRAVIDESHCIGCRKCIDACPVDAIVGARKLMHTVIANACTGCELCVPPCPVDCIAMIPVPESGGERWPDYADEEVARWRDAALARRLRLARRKSHGANLGGVVSQPPVRERIRAEIAQAVARVRARRVGPEGK
jgi:electron transport complex protein RnfB